MYLVQVDGTGRCVQTILKDPASYHGQTIGLACDELTVDQIVAVFNKVFSPAKTFINFNVSLYIFCVLWCGFKSFFATKSSTNVIYFSNFHYHCVRNILCYELYQSDFHRILIRCCSRYSIVLNT